MDYDKKLQTLANERKTLKQTVRKHKLAQMGLMENVGLYTQPILAEQEKTREAIESLKVAPKPVLKQSPDTPKKQIEFQNTYQIDFRNIDQTLPKSIRPVFSQDGFKIGKATIELDRQQRLMRVEGKHRTYEITQDLVDLIKGEPLENYSEPVKNDYNNLMEDVEGSRKAKRLSLLTPVKRGQGFLPDNVTEATVEVREINISSERRPLQCL